MPLMHAKNYQDGINTAEYWKSEKLDGIRAIWNGKALKTRSGKSLIAPEWFTEALPNFPVEGELWAGRGNFHIVQQTVLDKTPHTQSWKKISFMLFDMPHAAGDFRKRYFNIVHTVNQIDVEHIKYVVHTPIASEAELFHYLDNVSGESGEGVMLRKVTSRYQAGRSTDILKLKKFHDAEARVIGYRVGRGKYQGMLGSLLVKLDNGIEFYIGSGFSDDQRKHPPEIGSTVTFRHNGYTDNGVPKFARYLRERSN